MDGNVAERARLIFLRLIVEGGYTWRRSAQIRREGMAFQAEQVDLAALQEPRIRRAMGSMTRNTTLDLHRRVLEHKRPGLFCVALVTDSVL